MKNFTFKLLTLLIGFLMISASTFAVDVVIGGGLDDFPAPGASTTVGSGTEEFVFTTALEGSTILSTERYMPVNVTSDKIPCVKFGSDGGVLGTDEDDFFEGSLTSNSIGNDITAVEFWCVNEKTDPYEAVIVFSDKAPFDATSILTYETFVSPNRDAIAAAISVTVPAGTKSFRIYRAVTIAGTKYGGSTSTFLGYLKATIESTGPQAPKLETFSIESTTAVIAEDTVRVNLDYNSFTTGVTSVDVSTIAATCDSTVFGKHVMDIDSVSVLTTYTVGDTVKLVITNSTDPTLTNVYTVITTADIPVPTLTGPADTTQYVKQGEAITPIVLVAENTVSGSANGLPAGLTFDYASLTISGTATAPFGSYPYDVTLNGAVGASPSTATITGTIVVKDPSLKGVLYLTEEDAAAQSANLLLAQLQTNYDVTILAPVASVKLASEYSAYDLIVLHESIGSAYAAPTQEVGGLFTIDKPILSMKSYFYKADAWDLGAPSNGPGELTLEVEAGADAHPIFSGVTIASSLVSMVTGTGTDGKTVQSSTLSATTGGSVLATISGEENVCIHEMSAADRGITAGSSKYLMVALHNTMSSLLTVDALKLLDNACEYLLGTSAAAVQSQRANILSMTVGGVDAVVGATTATVILPFGSSVASQDAVVMSSRGASVTAPVSLTGINFSTPVTFTIAAEDGTTKDYTVTVTIATGIEEAVSSSKVYANNASIVVEGAIAADVSIVSLTGNILYKGVITNLTEILPVALEKGIYIVLLDGISKKVIVD